ncbi:glucose-6-phosphate isomerase [bacterium]|nr:glucose-6-phosphate isomerase [bacterium]|tara:strand:- start:3727 stop:4329 length:603 start_codon:yes stop_codon:yes gene_type:complete
MKHDLKNKTPDIRFLHDMQEVVYDQGWVKNAENFKAYYMYREFAKKENLKYNITIIPPRMISQEFIKTKGHYHKSGHAEIYIVLEGEAIYLMQKRDKKNPNIILDVFAIKAKKGDIAVIPKHYGHVSINPGNQELKMADWSCDSCESDYSLYVKNQGACYYHTKQGWIKNPKYTKVPELRFEKPVKNLPKNLEDFLCDGK